MPHFRLHNIIKAIGAMVLVIMPAAAAPPEVRGTWLTTSLNDAIASPQRTRATMKTLRDIGLNTVYVECWKDGYTEFPSDTMQRAIGISQRVNKRSKAIQRDLLSECVIEAHRNQLLCIAWFEYGFMAAHKDTSNELRAKREWLSLDQHGNEVAKNGFVWLNPLRPECQDLLIGIVVEAIKQYDLDGIQLDDRIVWPGLEMGYDDYTRRVYAGEHQGRQPPLDIKDRDWMKWRAEKVTAFSKRFVKAVRDANPHLIVSLSPGPHPWAYENYLCDWPRWTEWDEFLPQCYRVDHNAFAKSWNEQLGAMGDRRSKMIAGIRLVGDGPDQPPGDPTRSALLVRETGGAGHCWWYSRGVLGDFRSEISNLYDVKNLGHAPRPDRPVDHRPPPIIATRQDDGWIVDLPVAGRYREVHRINDQWQDLGTTSFIRGKNRLKKSTADAVELLIDRRKP